MNRADAREAEAEMRRVVRWTIVAFALVFLLLGAGSAYAIWYIQHS